MKKKALPKDKHTKASWKKRDEARKVNQQVYAANLLLAARDADDSIAGETLTVDVADELATVDGQ